MKKLNFALIMLIFLEQSTQATFKPNNFGVVKNNQFQQKKPSPYNPLQLIYDSNISNKQSQAPKTEFIKTSQATRKTILDQNTPSNFDQITTTQSKINSQKDPIIINEQQAQNLINQLSVPERINLHNFLMDVADPNKPLIMYGGPQSQTIEILPRDFKIFAKMLVTDAIEPIHYTSKPLLLEQKTEQFNSFVPENTQSQTIPESSVFELPWLNLKNNKTFPEPLLLTYDQKRNEFAENKFVENKKESSLRIDSENMQLPRAELVQEIMMPEIQTAKLISEPIKDTAKTSTRDRDIIVEKKPVFMQSINLKNNESSIKISDTQSEFISKIVDTFRRKMFTIMARNILRSSSHKMSLISHQSLSQIIMQYIQQLIFSLFNLSENIAIPQKNSLNNFKIQLQFIAQQIQSYNNQNIYNNPDQMLLLMQTIHIFLKENNFIFFSPFMLAKLDEVLKVATGCCDIWKNQNIIFQNDRTPADILLYFQPVVDNTNKLSTIKYSNSLMYAIYNSNGYMDNIMQTWQSFQTSDLYKDGPNKQYAAFLTFLLLFENSLVAAATIVDQTSKLYKVTNRVPVRINIS